MNEELEALSLACEQLEREIKHHMSQYQVDKDRADQSADERKIDPVVGSYWVRQAEYHRKSFLGWQQIQKIVNDYLATEIVE